MILLPSSVRVYVATAAANLRKSFEGLSNEVRCVLGDDPLSGHVFLFLNRRGCQVKMLVWTRGASPSCTSVSSEDGSPSQNESALTQCASRSMLTSWRCCSRTGPVVVALGEALGPRRKASEIAA
ncbi:MAG: IS66 family insertion sequence element accessory protein TnpB [Polyangiaceae bacterium]|nr:IS66 family insertion sequence element accessory protein TnpB [Polyangiaceae bacterium]